MLTLDRYCLRPLKEEDLNQILEWRNSDRIRMNMFNDSLIGLKEHKEWFERVSKENDDIYFVFMKDSQKRGLVYFNNIERKNGTCEWGFYLGNNTQPSSCGKVMGYLGVQYAFEQLHLRKLCGKMFAFNERSIKFHKKLGFVQEGKLIRHVLKNGIFEDVLLFSLFKEVWIQKREELRTLLFP